MGRETRGAAAPFWVGGWVGGGVETGNFLFLHPLHPAPRLCASFDLFIFPAPPPPLPPHHRVSDYNRRLDFRLHTMTTTDEAKWCVAAVVMCVRSVGTTYTVWRARSNPATTAFGRPPRRVLR